MTREIFEKVISGEGRDKYSGRKWHFILKHNYIENPFIVSYAIVHVSIEEPIGKNRDISTYGSFGPIQRDIEFFVCIPEFPLSKNKYNKLYKMIYNIVRHEIEHSAQVLRGIHYTHPKSQMEMVNFPYNFPTGNLEQDLQRTYKYLTNANEIEAMCTSSYYLAKKSGRSLNDILTYQLLRIRVRLSEAYEKDYEAMREIDDMLNLIFGILKEYIEKRFAIDAEKGGWYRRVKQVNPREYGEYGIR